MTNDTGTPRDIHLLTTDALLAEGLTGPVLGPPLPGDLGRTHSHRSPC